MNKKAWIAIVVLVILAIAAFALLRGNNSGTYDQSAGGTSEETSDSSAALDQLDSDMSDLQEPDVDYSLG